MTATANGAPPSVPAFLHPFARPAAESSSFVRIVGGKGARVWDDQGNTYIDAMASLWYCAVGHGRPEMAEAIARQAGTLGGYQCFDRFTNEPADALAERIASIAPETGSRVFFTAGGSEAVDTALKLVRLAHVLRGDPGRSALPITLGRDRRLSRSMMSRQKGPHAGSCSDLAGGWGLAVQAEADRPGRRPDFSNAAMSGCTDTDRRAARKPTTPVVGVAGGRQ